MSKTEADIALEIAEHARFMGMAAISYRKHFGDRAVEAAEKDVLGEALKLLAPLTAIVAGIYPELDEVKQARAVLALMSEGEKA